MSSIVLEFFATMTASLNRQAKLVEDSRGAASVVEKCVVSGVQLLSARIRPLHRDRDPVSEFELLGQHRRELNSQLRCGVDEYSPPRLDDATALGNPRPAPFDVLRSRNSVVETVLVVFPQIEWRVGEHCIDDGRSHVIENLQAVIAKEHSTGCREDRCLHVFASTVWLA